jgi:hypothetical protein
MAIYTNVFKIFTYSLVSSSLLYILLFIKNRRDFSKTYHELFNKKFYSLVINGDSFYCPPNIVIFLYLTSTLAIFYCLLEQYDAYNILYGIVVVDLLCVFNRYRALKLYNDKYLLKALYRPDQDDSGRSLTVARTKHILLTLLDRVATSRLERYLYVYITFNILQISRNYTHWSSMLSIAAFESTVSYYVFLKQLDKYRTNYTF